MSVNRGLSVNRDPNQRTGAAPSARMIETLWRLVTGAKGINGTTVSLTPFGMTISGGGATSYGKYCFGFTIAGAVVTVKAGEVCWGTHTPAGVGDTNVTITQDYQYVGIEYPAGGTVSILGPSTSRALFVSDDTTFRCWLHQFRLVNGAASIYRIGHIGNVEIPAWFGD